MTALRKAAQQALEALDTLYRTLTPETPLAKSLKQRADTLRAALAEPDTCTWQQDGDHTSGMYGTSCRRYFDLNDGTPEDNGMKWCCYCGKKLVQELITEDKDD